MLEKDKVVYEKCTATNGTNGFRLYSTKKYILKIIFDENNDKHWTSRRF